MVLFFVKRFIVGGFETGELACGSGVIFVSSGSKQCKIMIDLLYILNVFQLKNRLFLSDIFCKTQGV